MNKNKNLLIIVLLLLSIACNQSKKQGMSIDYKFEGSISEQVLRNYLSRAVTLSEFVVANEFTQDGENLCVEDDIRFIENTGTKFIGRAAYRWGKEECLNNPKFFKHASEIIARVHKNDPDIIFQAAVFEAVSKNVEQIKIPAKIFKILGLPVEERNFDYEAMLNSEVIGIDRWGKNISVPDITKIETRLWFMYLIVSYVDAGFEAIHLGQIAWIGRADKDFTYLFEFVTTAREYAKKHARRKYLIFDAHTPNKGVVKNGHLLLDFHSFPLRIKGTNTEKMSAVLDENYSDALYNKSKGGITPSGWKCEHLPYLVEFDNFGISSDPGNPVESSTFIWGYDEITWFSLLSEEKRNSWLEYAYNWIKKTDPNAYLQMPASRKVVDGKSSLHKFKANMKSMSCPAGTNLEEKIIELWNSH